LGLHQIGNANQSPIRKQARAIFPGWIELEEEEVSSEQRLKQIYVGCVEMRCFNWWWWLAQPGLCGNLSTTFLARHPETNTHTLNESISLPEWCKS